ncbi:MAG: FAD-dependent oxidoreductase [Dehalococcoidales bacterium]|nr:FAD-dependent oxidoreductase [Dehalococcoidales bacterium]
MKTVREPARDIKVWREVDVVVVGGGPGGVASAISAARTGAKTVLIERYGHLGGMATGGLVNIIPNLSDITGKQHIYGLTMELLNRLDKHGATSYPKKKDRGSADKKAVDYYLNANLGWFFVRKDLAGQQHVLYSAVVDPEILKAELNDMVLGAGSELLLHSWGTQVIMEGNAARGVFFESKSRRQAILGKVIIDATGDGDMFVAAGAECDNECDNKRRTAWLALVWWMTNINLRKFDKFKASQPEKYKELMDELVKLGGYPFFFRGILKNQPNTIWYHSMLPQPQRTDAMDVEQLTKIDIEARRRTVITHDFMKKYLPGFEKAFIMLTAPQLGTQGGRRIIGEYTLSEKDMETDEVFEDTIAVIANNDYGDISNKHPALCIPYRCLVPKSVDGLLVAGRAFSSADTINETFNIIPHCIAYGQAAGTAAALAIKAGVEPRKVDYKALRDNLVKQGVNLPKIERSVGSVASNDGKKDYFQKYRSQ